jgi:hypothetical protein
MVALVVILPLLLVEVEAEVLELQDPQVLAVAEVMEVMVLLHRFQEVP